MRLLVLLFFLPFACTDETISGYADTDAIYRLQEISGDPFTARATIAFPEEGIARGDAPCNNWSAQQSAPYPWIELSQIQVTRRACTELAAEQEFFRALENTTLVEVQGDILILTDEDGNEMVFVKEN